MIIFMYCVSFTVLIGQYLIADVFGFTLVSPVTGVPMKSSLLVITDPNKFQSIEANMTTISKPDLVGIITGQTFGAWGNIFMQLLLIFTGTEIFQVLVFFGIPGIVAFVVLVPYYILLGRAILGYLKQFF